MKHLLVSILFFQCFFNVIKSYAQRDKEASISDDVISGTVYSSAPLLKDSNYVHYLWHENGAKADYDVVKYFNDNFVLPTDMSHYEGNIIVKFIVRKDGTIDEVYVVRPFKEAYINEIKRVVLSMPKWKPAMKDGVAVHSYITFPFYILQD